ncbi:MAG: cupin domain-containing protein [Clostridia bacterium]|jgi:quercetin dioxygenase-like cupin family protein|nr:cupin domain-containing protein [Clostridia bacterium]
MMIETIFTFTKGNDKQIEKIREDEKTGIGHFILPPAEAAPEHDANSTVYIIVVRGIITLQLDDQEAHTYPAGNIIEIPRQTKMNIKNAGDETLEAFALRVF